MAELFFPLLQERCYTSLQANGISVYTVPRPNCAVTHIFVGICYGSMDTVYVLNGRLKRTPQGSAACLCTLLQERSNSMGATLTPSMTGFYQAVSGRPYDAIRSMLQSLLAPDIDVSVLSYVKAKTIKSRRLAASDEKESACIPLRTEGFLPPSDLAKDYEMDKIASDVLKACHSAFYQPENMVLCVIGDVRASEVERAAASAAGMRKPQIPVRDYSAYELRSEAAQDVTSEKDTAEPVFALGFRADVADSLRKRLIAVLACESLFGRTSLLYRDLLEKGIVTDDFSVECIHAPDRTSILLTGASAQPAAVSEAVLSESIRIAWNGLEEERFTQAKQRLLNRLVCALDDCRDTCLQIAQTHFAHSCYFDFDAELQKIEKHEIEDYIRDTITGENSMLSVVCPKGALS